MKSRAVLLANLGSPERADESAVRNYLDQFLMDPYVIQLPWLLRRLIVSFFVLPSRPKQSAKAYQSIWMTEGSPLIVLSNCLQQSLQQRLDIPVSIAMRYGKPSIENQLVKLAENSAITEVFFIPLYPHYADSTVTTSIEEARRVIKKHQLEIQLKVLPPFYQQNDYINLLVENAKSYIGEDFEHLLFSYHGLPESHIRKADPTGQHCLKAADCCTIPSPAHESCYRHQAFKTTQCFVEQLGLSNQQYSIAFQSRLGRAKWLNPSTEDKISELAAKGIKRLTVLCPSFVTDCLETLEEIDIRAKKLFIEAGGETLTLIPCLNDSPAWVELLANWCQQD